MKKLGEWNQRHTGDSIGDELVGVEVAAIGIGEAATGFGGLETRRPQGVGHNRGA